MYRNKTGEGEGGIQDTQVEMSSLDTHDRLGRREIKRERKDDYRGNDAPRSSLDLHRKTYGLSNRL